MLQANSSRFWQFYQKIREKVCSWRSAVFDLKRDNQAVIALRKTV
jgi:hypothetical protein